MKNWAYWRVKLFGPAHSLGRRITIYTITFSSAIMLVISVAQLGFEYRDLRSSLDKELDGIEVFVPNLSGSVWSFDQKQIQLALDGLKRLPNIQYVRVMTTEGGKEWISGRLQPSNTLSRNFDLGLIIKGKNTVIGQLTVVASLDEINQHIFDRALTILLSSGLKSFLVALFSLFLFRHLIARRLEKMTGNLHALTPLVFPAAAETEMPAQNSPERSDELDVVEWALSRTANDLKRASVELEQHRDHLEALVEESTHELRMQNEELRQTRDALDASRARYVDLYDLAPVGYCSENEAGLITQANLALATLLGVPRSALAWKQLFSDFVLPEDQSKWYKLRIQSRASDASQTCELRLRHVSLDDGVDEAGGAGASVWVQLAVTLVRDDTGEQLRHIAVSDISGRKRLEAAREDALSLLKGTTDRVPGVVYQYKLRPDGSSCFPFASQAVREIYRVTPEDVREDASPVFSILHPDDYAAVGASIQQSARDMTPWAHEYRVKFDDGTVRWLRGDALPHRESDGCVLWHGFITDITEQKQAQSKLLLAASVFSHAREGITITDIEGTIVDVNQAFTRITGYLRDEVIGQNPRILSSGRNDKAFYEALWRDLTEQGHWSGEMWNRRKNDEVYAELITISAVRDGQGRTQHYVALFSDITAIKAHQSQLEHIAHFDALADRLQLAMAQAQRREQQLTVVYLDLDGFKAINDRHGHEAGDQVLINLAMRMKQALREGDTLARLGGDEFVALLIDLEDMAASVPMLTRLLSAAAQPVQWNDLSLQVSASMGVTFFPQAHDIDADQLLRQADQAMYQAKLTGKNCYRIFDAAHDRELRGHHESLERIRVALENHEFV
ncbi:MAG: diguanylate cyclase, partial [Rhodoferax sp.]|nr:diguanylate cyclase [Rhodoferax sp.]